MRVVEKMVSRMARTILYFVAFMLVAGFAKAQDAQQANSFLESVYMHYEKGGKGIDFTGPGAGAYYHSSLLALIREDIKANGPENVPAIDSDPICGCQDWDGIWDLKIDVKIDNPQRATVRVSFFVFQRRGKDDLNKLVITLVPEHGQWRIYDILDESNPKMNWDARKALADDLQTIRQNKAPQSSH
jgi:hypothetical protein